MTTETDNEAPGPDAYKHVDDLALHLFVSTDRLAHDQGLRLLVQIKQACAADILTDEAARAAAWIPPEPKHRTLEQRGIMRVVDSLRARAQAVAPRTPHVTTATPSPPHPDDEP
ncbi:hypothetical protein ACIOWI_29675 [Streptomyces sp. NPDC087659]|uniref:hypothetical protein n=1 Tax=Streptomyces sp. NPDC087659 TaxID=3365801 RepID=UPI0038288DDA